MKGFQKWEEKGSSNYPFTHGGTGTSKCGIGTKSALPCFFLIGTGTNKCGTSTKFPLPLFYIMGTGTSMWY